MKTIKAAMSYLKILFFRPQFSILEWFALMLFYTIYDMVGSLIAITILLAAFVVNTIVWNKIMSNWRETHLDE